MVIKLIQMHESREHAVQTVGGVAFSMKITFLTHMTPNDPRLIIDTINIIEGLKLTHMHELYEYTMECGGKVAFLLKMNFWFPWPQMTLDNF